jgi:hypothetical protein
VTLALAGCSSSPETPDPPPRVALLVLVTTLEVINDKEEGSGDWRITVRVDGHQLGAPALGEANSGGAVAIERQVLSQGPELDHRVIVSAKVEEHDGGFDNTWNLIGNDTLVFGPAEGWGVGAHAMAMETDEGKVNVHVRIVRTMPTNGASPAAEGDRR